MNIFSKWKRNKDDELQTQAENLVAAAQILATSTYTSTAERFDVVYSIPTDRWDTILTIAGVFMAATRANNIGLPEARVSSLMEIVSLKLDAWQPEGIPGFEDCKSFFDRAYDDLEKDAAYQDHPEFLGSDAIGGWIVWNLFGRAPESAEESGLVRALGAIVARSFFDWWSREPGT